jgi:hypothetical protein
MPAVNGLVRRAVVAGIRPSHRTDLPETELLVRGVGADVERLRRYARVCGFRLADTLPPTYPHVLAFPLALELMARPNFPLPLVGLVHVANAIEVSRPLDRTESFDLAVRAENLRPHERGRTVDLVATATVGGSVVWRGRSAYLHRDRTSSRGSVPSAQPPTPSAVWRVGADVGRAYAEVSGDRNPIHTSTLAARLFGFPRRIAHGMWSKARCLAALEGRLPESFVVDVSFKLPILLPASVAFSASPDHEGWTLALHDARSGKPHLVGSIVGR